jgi:hypothetical protein
MRYVHRNNRVNSDSKKRRKACYWDKYIDEIVNIAAAKLLFGGYISANRAIRVKLLLLLSIEANSSENGENAQTTIKRKKKHLI